MTVDRHDPPLPEPRFLEGELTYVRGLTRGDLDGPWPGWTNDREVTRTMFRGAYPSTRETTERELERAIGNTTDIELAVVDRETDAHIGVTGLHSLNMVARSCEFRILIGDKRYWNGGFGTEATQLMCVYAFEVLNMNKVWLGVCAGNPAAVRAYEKAGFTREGTLRQESWRNSRYYDVIRMSLLRTEYDERKEQWAIADRIREQFPQQ